MATFCKLTRIYKKKGENKLRTQNITISVDDISTARTSNRLGFPEHRATVVLKSGQSVDVVETIDVINTRLGVR